MSELAAVRLRNGDELPAVLAQTTMLALQSLLADKPIVFYELVEMCRDPQHQPFGNTLTEIQAIGLADAPDGKIHDSVRSIIQSAVTGDGFNLTLSSPVADA